MSRISDERVARMLENEDSIRAHNDNGDRLCDALLDLRDARAETVRVGGWKAQAQQYEQRITDLLAALRDIDEFARAAGWYRISEKARRALAGSWHGNRLPKPEMQTGDAVPTEPKEVRRSSPKTTGGSQ